LFGSVLGKAYFLFQDRPLVAYRTDNSYEQRYEIPRVDWPWALRGKDPTTWEIMEAEAGPEDARPLFLSLTIYMDKFRRGWYVFWSLCVCFFCLEANVQK